MTDRTPTHGRPGAPPHYASRAALAGILAFALALSAVAEDSAKPGDLLDESDRALIARLGKDVLGARIDPIDPAKLIEAFLQVPTAEFLVIENAKTKSTVPITLQPGKKLSLDGKPVPPPLWTLTVPKVIDEYITRHEDGLSAPLLSLGRAKLALSYDPPQPTILLEGAPGQARSFEVTASVHPADDLSTVKYSGKIRVTYTNKGSYRIKTPAGSFDGMLLRLDFQGKLGPATMNDSDLRIYSPEVGLLAIATHNRLHAMLVVNRDEHITLLLAKKPTVGK